MRGRAAPPRPGIYRVSPGLLRSYIGRKSARTVIQLCSFNEIPKVWLMAMSEVFTSSKFTKKWSGRAAYGRLF